jgi:hypothetical protein
MADAVERLHGRLVLIFNHDNNTQRTNICYCFMLSSWRKNKLIHADDQNVEYSTRMSVKKTTVQ